jgi:DNA (cytosine-5)-methyltransferase 1
MESKIKICDICNGEYPIDKHNFEECYSLDYKWDLKQMKQIKYIDLFCGMGSFHESFKKYGWKCVMACDIDKHARDTYFNNYGILPLGDIADINPQHIENYDIVCAGFPCQPFSQCGHRKGFKDGRGTMFHQVMKFVDKKPKVIVLENVQGLLKHDDGKTFKTITNIIEEKGYTHIHKVLKCEKYGIPQKRRRLFILCIRNDIKFSNNIFDFSEYEHDTTLTEYLSEVGIFKRRYAFTLRCGGRLSPIDDRHNWDGYYIKTNDEKKWKEWRLSIEAGLKLQGFPSNFKFSGSISKQWKRLGNTIPVIFTTLMGNAISKIIEL